MAFRPFDAATFTAWSSRLSAGGLVTEAARERDLRRALPHLARAIETAGLLPRLPPDERALLAAARLSSAASAARLAVALEPLGAACEREGVRPLLLKGAALHGALHRDPADRPVSDADLYLAFAHWPALSRALAAADLVADDVTQARLETLVRSGGRTPVLSDFVFRRRDRTGVPVEVKFDPVQVGVPLGHAAEFAAHATPSPRYRGFDVPAPEAMAIQQALHLARHDGTDALWFAELAHGVARAGATFDPGRAMAMIRGEGLASVVATVFAAAEAMFPGTIPAPLRGRGSRGPVPAILRLHPRRPGRADERRATRSLQVHHAFASGRGLLVLRSLLSRIHPSDAYVAARAGLAPGTRVHAGHRVRRLLELIRGSTP